MTQTPFDPARLGAIGPDIDLDEEEVFLTNGERLTEEEACQIADEVLGRHRGREEPA